MGDILGHSLAAPVGKVLIVAGIVFLGIAVVGKISGKIDPGTVGRIGGALVGGLLLLLGLGLHLGGDEGGAQATGPGRDMGATPPYMTPSAFPMGMPTDIPPGFMPSPFLPGAPPPGFMPSAAFDPALFGTPSVFMPSALLPPR